ncbi:MAG TPA: sugar phosphate isomerase/epimerase [Acidobacteria bacterium]|uniref:Xylose isomerase-like TIM barrel domain-containing protein n=1 Tax=marine metagenome TaxID=408172 RepID=A0A381R5I5_9ZZZZ|nr:sugar phosphate isomerase/epimerase [Acidobacteriota bacterium]
MTVLTRRAFHKLAGAGLLAAAAGPRPRAQRGRAESRVAGVLIGAQSYSFRDRDLQGVIDGMVEVGLTSCELWEGHVEPADLRRRDAREELRRWRTTIGLDYFTAIRERFGRAGLTLNSYNLSFKDHFSDEEIDRGFEMAKALGVPAITASANVNVVARVAPRAAYHGLPVAIHNHSQVDPNEFSSPDQFAAAMAQGNGKSIAVNLDIGHYSAANHDPVAYLRDHHEQVITLHLKDRKRDQGENMVWGEGDTDIVSVLAMLRDHRWDIPANIEYEYRGGDTIEEMRRCFEFCKRALA